MTQSASPIDDDRTTSVGPCADAGIAGEEATETGANLRALMDDHFEFIWRSLRRLGIAPAALDDATQQVFWTASRKLDVILPGRERSFLFGIATRVASDMRRMAQRQRQREAFDGDQAETAAHPAPLADELVDRKRARALLDRFLDGLSMDVRTAYVLYEGEGMTVPEIADLVDAPPGTISSRLRLARKQFGIMVERLRAADQHGGGT
jgi:RNA polymerase sigma-70 factor (ECF subfamily)